ncbi:MAG: metallophosphoesterase [Sandaracinaceae bacterium]
MSWFALGTIVSALAVTLAAGLFRNRYFASFVAVILTVQALCAIGLYPLFEGIAPVYIGLQAAVHIHMLALTQPRMRPLWWRALISVPGFFFTAGTWLALPWAVITAFGFEPYGAWVPFVVAAVGVVQSLYTREEEIDLVLDGEASTNEVGRYPRGSGTSPRPLTFVQITDPHLGPLMSVKRLRRICERAVERAPDVIFLTGDFLTMESQADPQVMVDALMPLKAYEGRVFACLGNHDHEAPALVRNALRRCGVTLLVDEEAVFEAPTGPLQILGCDFSFRERKERLADVCERFPRRDGHLRVVLLHDPGAFKHLPEGHGDLVLSGHTHGGQVGLLSLGAAWTFVSGFTSIPDHGFWARGTDRMYVHRGTGVYGFPLRVGVPGEQSLVRLHRSGV